MQTYEMVSFFLILRSMLGLLHMALRFYALFFSAHEHASILIGDQGIGFNVLLRRKIHLKQHWSIKQDLLMEM